MAAHSMILFQWPCSSCSLKSHLKQYVCILKIGAFILLRAALPLLFSLVQSEIGLPIQKLQVRFGQLINYILVIICSE